ncbi:MAG: DNA polymerase III subunit delta' [Deltaproteobacteria bacterium]|nr:DNA polymerase III subunit delta' [Deltaproteobacteria bacterium]MBW2053467.1 DNA polymerase III subunit delta' [Deltaproteobacteria bacterium]MBW2139745.1 DNA polymerase III subunit delta' [Deltaproteobacteria bacterium]MBW2324565.1 DNA polymerase III subunit delta' [Deltaproteobacteria bacterium]
MGFEQLIGHERPLKMIRAMLLRERLPHALLITGPTGVGKRTFALALAQAVNCERLESGEPCGICPACDKIGRGIHPDVIEIEPEGRSRVIKIERIREMRTQISFRPFEGRTKVFLVREAQNMHEASANALLKTLEEPPPASLIILTVPEETDLLPTVVSRCLRLSLAPLSRQVIEDWLERERGITGAEAHLLASLSGGCPGRVVDIEAEAVWDQRRETLEKLTQVESRDYTAALDWAESLARDENERVMTFDLLRFWYRDLMILSCQGDERHLINSDLLDELKRFKRQRKTSAFSNALNKIDDAEEALGRMARPDLVMENLMLNLFETLEG